MHYGINTNFHPHMQLEGEVRDYLEKREFLLEDFTYHAKASEVFQKRLREMYTPTSLYLRGRADKTALHKSFDLAFQWEAKSHASRTQHDCTLEALPLAHHLNALCLGVDCLYCYCHKNRHYGFWVSQLPPIREIKIPDRWEDFPEILLWFHGVLDKFYPGIRKKACMSRGSGDIFVIIDEKDISKYPDWKSLVRTDLKNKKHTLRLPKTFRKVIQTGFQDGMT